MIWKAFFWCHCYFLFHFFFRLCFWCHVAAFPGMRKPFRLDVKNRKGEVSVFVNIVIPSKYLWRFHFPGAIQVIPWEINVKQRKPLVVYIYRPPDQNLDHFLSFVTGLLDHYLKSYKDFVIIGDFNGNESNEQWKLF